MRIRIFAMLSLVVLMTLLVFGSLSAQNVAESEPNNAFGAANVFTVGSPVAVTISPAGDRDWFEFTVDQHGELALNITDVAPELAVNARLWNGNKDTLTGWYAPLAAGGNTEVVIDLPAPGRYVLEVAGGESSQESTQPFTLGTTFTPSADDGEPNNSFGAAAGLTLGQPIPATILPAGDRDWYAFDVDQHGELRINISDVPSALAVNARVWNGNKDTLTGWYAPLAPGGDTEAVVDLPAPGRYVLEIAAGDGNQRAIEPFTLQLDFRPSVDDGEPNNNFGAAAHLDLGQPVFGTILPAGDRDWYTFDVDHHGELRLAITDVPETTAATVRVWNNNKDTLTGWFNPLAVGGDTFAVVDLAVPGRYVLELTTTDGNQRDILPYTLLATFTPAPDNFEPNNSFGAAQPLDLDTSIPVNVLPAGDHDWFEIVVPHHGRLQVVASQVPREVAVQIRFWNGNKDTLTGWFSPLAKGGDTEALVDLPAPGRYYIQAAASDGNQRDINPYLLTTRYRAAADQGEPNDTVDVATKVNLDETIPGNILPAGDRDWCEIQVEEPGDLHILVLDAAPDLDINFRVWDAGNTLLTDWFKPAEEGGDVTAVSPIEEVGTYFVEVVASSSAVSSIDPYLLRFSMQPIDPAEVVPPEDESAGDAPAVEPVASETVDPTAGDDQVVDPVGTTLEGVRVQIPANALPAGEEVLLEVGLVTNFDQLSIERVTHPELGMLSVPGSLIPVGPVVSLRPEDLVFDTPVRVEIPVDPDSVAPNAAGYWVLLGNQDENGAWTWELVAENALALDLGAGTATALVDHFGGLAAVGVVGESESETGAEARPATPEEIAALKQMLTEHIDQFSAADACFAALVSLGDAALFDAALDAVAVTIDPGLADATSELSADGNTLLLSISPDEVSATGRDDFAAALWRALARRLQIDNGDRWHWSVFADDLRGEYDSRFVDYAAVLIDALEAAQEFAEDVSAEEVDVVEAARQWELIQAGLSAGSDNRYATVPDLSPFQQWTGFDVALGTIEEAFARGQCGPVLQQAMTTPAEATAASSAAGGEGYGVFLASNDEVLVGQLSTLVTTPSCALIGWDVDCNKTVAQVATLNQVLGPFASEAEAIAAYCADLAPGSLRRQALVVGVRGQMGFDGQEHWVSNAPVCN